MQVVNSDEDAFVRVAINTGPNRGFQFKTHPNIDKGAYSASNTLGLKDPSRPFPTGRYARAHRPCTPHERVHVALQRACLLSTICPAAA